MEERRDTGAAASPRERAENLPCWSGPVEARPLSGGISNHNFVVEDGGRKYVVRIGGDHLVHNVMRFNEHGCAAAAEAAGLTPRTVYREPDVFVIEFVDGRTFEPADVPANLDRILPLVRRLHVDGTAALRGPVLAFWPFRVHRHYAHLLRDGGSRMIPELPRILEINDELEAAVGPVDLALCHNDLLAANFIDTGERLWIVDWEHAGYGAPLFDLANLASNSLFATAQERRMLEAYYGAPADDGLWRRYKAMRAASHLREATWSMVAELHSTLDFDYVAYTDENLAAFEDAYRAFRELS